MTKWKQYQIKQEMYRHRTGWAGVWDALVSAITGRERHSFPHPVTITFYAKANSQVMFNATQVELEEKI